MFDETASYIALFFSPPLHQLVSFCHPPTPLFRRSTILALTHIKMFITSLQSLLCLITVSVTAPVAFFFFSRCTFCRLGCLQCWPPSSTCGDPTPQSEREERAGASWKEGRETSLAAVIGQEVGCLDMQALLSLSLPLLSQWAVSSVVLCFHLFPPLSLSLSFSQCLFSSLN